MEWKNLLNRFSPFRQERSGSAPAGLTREQLEEAAVALAEVGLDSHMLQLMRENVGWMRLGGDAGYGHADPERTEIVRLARRYAVNDGLCAQVLHVWVNFTLGRGISYRAKDDKTQDVLDEFWKMPSNRSVFRPQGQRVSSGRMLVDGEIFFALFPGKGAQVPIRRIDPLEITEIVANPEDKDAVVLYKREFTTRKGGLQTIYYRDMYGPPVVSLPGDAKSGDELEENAVVYHATFGDLGARGTSLLATTLDWTKAHRNFMKAREAIQAALAMFAWKRKFGKGTPAMIAARKAALQSGLVTGDTENNPPPIPGSTHLETAGEEMSPIKTDTGASNARVDGDMILQRVGVGPGVFPHYLGAGESFRLATATAMELPMLKQFEAFQQLWQDIYQDLFQFVLFNAGISEDKLFVDIDFPDIVTKDSPNMIHAVAEILAAIPRLGGSDEFLHLALSLLSIDNPTEVIKALNEKEPGGNGNGKTPEGEATEKLIEAMRNLAATISAQES